METILTRLPKGVSRVRHAFLFMLLSVFVLSYQQSYAQQTEQSYRSAFGPNALVGYLAYTPTDYAAHPDSAYPLLIFLHGQGEKVWNPQNTSQLYKVKANGPPKLIDQGQQFPFIVISPQCPFSGWDDVTTDNYQTSVLRPGEFVDEIIEKMKTIYRVDPNRIYITGLSMGGASCWTYTLRYPQKIAASIPIAGWGDGTSPCGIASNNVAVWAFQGQNDGGSGIQGLVNSINACNPAPTPLAKATIYAGVGHDAWTQTYNNTGPGIAPDNIYDWLLRQHKNGNLPPIANAGADKVLTLPTNSTTISGSGTDSDGTIASYAWTKVSGGTATLTNANTATLSVSGLAAGAYVFRLTVTDNLGTTGTDNVTVTVNASNQAPVANAGADKVLTLPTNSTTITGTGTDSDGTIASYAWTKVSGGAATLTNAATATLSVSGLAAGAYVFRLTVTDNLGATGTDDVNVTVNAAGTGDGLTATYFPTINLTGTPVTAVVPTVSFNWGTGIPVTGIPADNFSARFSGQVQPLYTQTYTFYTTSDDGVRLWVNGTQVINNWTDHGPIENSGTIALTAGQKYNIVLEYYEHTSGATISLSWSSSSQAKQIIPQAQLFSTTPAANGTGLKGEYYNTINFSGTPVVKTDTTVNYDWLLNAPFSGIRADSFSVRWTGSVKAQYTETYTFYTTSDDGVRLTVNGVLLINNWTPHGAIENSATIALTAGQQYDILLEYYERTSLATIKLSWSSTSQAKQIIPKKNLYLPVSPRTAALAPEAEETTVATLLVYPVPAGNSATVVYTATAEGTVVLQLADQQSKTVLTKTFYAAAGKNTVELDLSGLANGLYVLTLNGSVQQTSKILVAK